MIFETGIGNPFGKDVGHAPSPPLDEVKGSPHILRCSIDARCDLRYGSAALLRSATIRREWSPCRATGRAGN